MTNQTEYKDPRRDDIKGIMEHIHRVLEVNKLSLTTVSGDSPLVVIDNKTGKKYSYLEVVI